VHPLDSQQGSGRGDQGTIRRLPARCSLGLAADLHTIDAQQSIKKCATPGVVLLSVAVTLGVSIRRILNCCRPCFSL
jgi:hypothetical protein